MHDRPTPDELERATQARLARLASVPVDTTNLERRLKAAIAREAEQSVDNPQRWSLQRFKRWIPLSTLAAAVVVIAVTLGIVGFGSGASPVVAAPADFARLHDAMNDHAATATAVAGIEEANRVIAGEWSDAPPLPMTSEVDERIHACCLHDFKNRKVVCVLMRDSDNTSITMVVARAQDVKPAQIGTAVHRNGRKYMVHNSNGLSMVMVEGSGKYVCLMGKLPIERLLTIADGLSF